MSRKITDFNLNDTKQISQDQRQIHNVDEMNYFIGLNEFKPKLASIESECCKFAIMKCDGNNFYRTFMFGLIESYILQSNISEIKRIIFDFNKVIDIKFKRNNIIVIKDQCFNIFNLIIDCLENNKIKKAYIIFCNSINLFSNFDMVNR